MTRVAACSRWFCPWSLALLIVLALGLVGVSSAHAAGTVTNCASFGDPGTPGYLAWALVGGGTVTFACSGTIVVPEIVLTEDTVIDGAWQSVTLSGNGANRVIFVTSGITVELKDLVLANGATSPDAGSGASGAGIYNAGILTLTDSTVRANSAMMGHGGGIFNASGSLTLTNTTVSDNSVRSVSFFSMTGGGIFNASGGVVTLTDSTVIGNFADYGGGIYNTGDSLTLTNSTVSGNVARLNSGGNAGGYGGGIYNIAGVVTLTNSTVSGNHAVNQGGGIGNASGSLALTNSTVGDNYAFSGGSGIDNGASGTVTLASSIIAQQGQGRDCARAVTSLGYNLDSDGTCNLAAIGDISGGIADLQPLAMNPPGTTWTHALGPNSQALDAIPLGTNGCGTTITADQRGVERPQGAGCEMGAYEVSTSIDTVTIRQAIFANLFKVLGVVAESSASPEAELTLTVPNCLTNEPMRWSEDAQGYVLLRRITSCGNLDGQTATVTSSHGGVATATIR